MWLMLLLVLVAIFPPLLLADVFAASGGLVFLLAAWFPPLQRLRDQMVLRSTPELGDGTGTLASAEHASFRSLVGETGQTTTVLRPSGKARFGDMHVDVTADGRFIEAARPVLVIDVQGRRVLVEPVGA
jgi:membrane-bound serine protease (ClpP class)